MTSMSPRRCNSAGPSANSGNEITPAINEDINNRRESSLICSSASSSCHSQREFEPSEGKIETEIIDQSVGIKYKRLVEWPKLSERMAKSSHARFEKMNYITTLYEETLSSSRASRSSMITLTRSNLAIKTINNSTLVSNSKSKDSSTSASTSISTINYPGDSNRPSKWKSKSNYIPIGSDVRILSKIENELGPLRGKLSELTGKFKALNLIDVNSVFVNRHFDNCNKFKVINNNNNSNFNCAEHLNHLGWHPRNVTSASACQMKFNGEKKFLNSENKNVNLNLNLNLNLTSEGDQPGDDVSEKYENKFNGINKKFYRSMGEEAVERKSENNFEGKNCEQDSICDGSGAGAAKEESGERTRAVDQNNGNFLVIDKAEEDSVGEKFDIIPVRFENCGMNNSELVETISELRAGEQCEFGFTDSPPIYFNGLRMSSLPEARSTVDNKPDICVGERQTKSLRGMTCSPEDFY